MTSIAHRSLFAVLSLVCLACAGAPRGSERQDRTEGNPSMTANLSGIDHVILGINDLQQGIEELERLTGVRAVYGGAHPGRGTQNALLSLGEPYYLEILAPNPEEQGDSESVQELRNMTTLTPIGWAARAEDLPALQDRLKGQGIETGEIRPGARNRPDGTRLAWKTLAFAPSSSHLLPFFIDWDSGSAHPSTTSPGGCRLTGFALEDPAPEPLRETFRSAGLQVEVRDSEKAGIWFSLTCPKGSVDFR